MLTLFFCGKKIFFSTQRNKCIVPLRFQVESIEGNLFLKSKRLIPLSVQEIVDCGWHARYPNGYSDEGWYGAVVLDLKLLLRGLESEETYPYHGMKKKGDHCHYDLVNFDNPIVTYVTGVKYALGEYQTAELLQEGPLANGINARARSFQFYSKGTN